MSNLVVTNTVEEGLVKVVNDKLDMGVYLHDYKVVEFSIYSQEILNKIIKTFKLKDVGTSSDFPRTMPQDGRLYGPDLIVDPKQYRRILVSKKYDMVMYYTAKSYYIDSMVLIEEDKLAKFKKKIRKIILNDDASSIFRKSEFETEEFGFIELSESSDEKKVVDIIKRTVPDENLVFDKESTINEVMADIKTFFTEDTEKLYKKLHIAYKRGVILYGDPGNGKSAMIRQIMRSMPDITKVVLNSNIKNITRVLNSLIKSMDGSPVIIIIEDMDSVINDYNRSELLNILDGVDIKSGVFFIGTTNYYEKIDPAFMNRSGRFDRTYKIDNPGDETRRLFFESRDVDLILSDYLVYNTDEEDKSRTVIDLFVEYSDGMPMANLKELITSTSYLLASVDNITIKDAVIQSSDRIKNARSEHSQSHNSYVQNRKDGFSKIH